MSFTVDVRRLRFRYGGGPWVLDIPELTLERGTRAFLFGPSGSGKTTLLGVMAGVLEATEGEIRVLGEDLASLSGARRDAFRAEHIGYVFQMFNLIPYLTVLDNIALTCSHARGAPGPTGRQGCERDRRAACRTPPDRKPAG